MRFFNFSRDEAEGENVGPWQFIMLVLSIYILMALFVETAFILPLEISRILQVSDFAICIIFIFDFFKNLITAKRKLHYLKWGWIDLLASIPMVDAFRVGRLFRIIRLLRILRAVRSAKHISSFIFRNKAKGAFSTVVTFSFLIMVISSIAILNVELDNDSNIKTAEDAIWWAFVTMTTVGYGDKYPITTGGRIIAAILMTAGVGLFGTITGYVASWFLEEEEKESEKLNNLEIEIREIRKILEDR